jgi:hypothetical protein
MMSIRRFDTRAASIVVFVTALAASAGAQPAAPPDHPLMPQALEIELALSAAPKHLRDGATVMVLGPTGYIKAREGTNAFTCIVNRRGGDLFPVCWDAEGARSVLPVDVDAVKARLDGASNADVDRLVADGYKSGRYHPPARAGISYMLSPMRYRIDEQGRVTRTNSNPHLMFYGPNLTDADIGGQRGTFAFINRVGPDGMIIVPVGSVEREAILKETQSLTERVERQIGYKSPQ